MQGHGDNIFGTKHHQRSPDVRQGVRNRGRILKRRQRTICEQIRHHRILKKCARHTHGAATILQTAINGKIWNHLLSRSGNARETEAVHTGKAATGSRMTIERYRERVVPQQHEMDWPRDACDGDLVGPQVLQIRCVQFGHSRQQRVVVLLAREYTEKNDFFPTAWMCLVDALQNRFA